MDCLFIFFPAYLLFFLLILFFLFFSSRDLLCFNKSIKSLNEPGAKQFYIKNPSYNSLRAIMMSFSLPNIDYKALRVSE